MSANVYREHLVLPGDRVISAFDNMAWNEAISQAGEIGPYIGMAKTNSLSVRDGADHAVSTMAENGLYTMLDSKFHDIPETVEGEVREATLAGASLITVHASGALKMLEAAVRGRDKGRELTRNVFHQAAIDRIGGVLGITVLTSLKDECTSIYGDDVQTKVVDFANLALEAELDGIVCSVPDLKLLQSNSNFDALLKVVPGITPKHAKKASDQQRTGTPAEAIENGADMIVVGRGINKAADYGMTKAEAAQAVAEEVKEALSGQSA